MIAMTVTIAVIAIGVIVAIVATLASQTSATRVDTGSTGSSSDTTGGTAPLDTESLLTEDTHILNQGAEGAPVLVEFLDFECEACAAFYPYVEDLRETYGDSFTYAVRYFPIPGHANSMTSAVAVEAAAQQGEFEAMYRLMYETQPEWGEKQESQAAVFRGFAEDLGLDMEAYDAAVADPATEARVQQDFDAGQAVGVSGTPTFFLDGAPLQLERFDDLDAAVAAAIQGE